jgi:hypothetical protein
MPGRCTATRGVRPKSPWAPRCRYMIWFDGSSGGLYAPLGRLLVRSIIPPRLEAVIRARLGISAPPAGITPWQADVCDPSEFRGASSHPRLRREIPDASPIMLSREEITRALLRYRYDRDFRGPRRVPIKTLADFVGLSHETLFQAMRGSVSDRTRAKLSWALVAIDRGRLCFRRHGQCWQAEVDNALPTSVMPLHSQ